MFTSTKDDATKYGKENMANEGGPSDNTRKNERHFNDEAREAAQDVKEDLKDAACRAGRHARNLADTAVHDFENLGDTIACKLRKKPLQSVATVFGVGFVLGVLFRR